METFPSYPVLQQNGFGESESSNVLRTAMEGAIPKQRPLSSLSLKTVPVSYALLSLSAYNTFMDWIRVDLSRGTAWFTWTDPTDSAAKTARIAGGIDKVRRTPRNGMLSLWDVEFDIEVVV